MDFRRESENIERFQRYFRDDPTVRAPEVFDEYTRRRVLVMERCTGTKIDRLHDQFAKGRIEFNEVMEHLTGLYLRMMMVDGFLHADPHPGNLLVQDDGTIVVLDWGMVLEVPSWTREYILDLALTVERDDLDGMINGMYRLGMISPEVSRGEIREAATEILGIMASVRSSNQDRVEEIVQEIFDTFYTWPLMLPQELVYLFRTSVLLEGIGIRYDENFDGLGLLKRVVRDMKGEIVKTSVRQPVAVAKDLLGEAQSAIRTMIELLGRAEREELRVRVSSPRHPRPGEVSQPTGPAHQSEYFRHGYRGHLVHYFYCGTKPLAARGRSSGRSAHVRAGVLHPDSSSGKSATARSTGSTR